MDEQKETVTSVDPATGQSSEVKVVLDHVKNAGMAYTLEEVDSNGSGSKKNQ